MHGQAGSGPQGWGANASRVPWGALEGLPQHSFNTSHRYQAPVGTLLCLLHCLPPVLAFGSSPLQAGGPEVSKDLMRGRQGVNSAKEAVCTEEWTPGREWSSLQRKASKAA